MRKHICINHYSYIECEQMVFDEETGLNEPLLLYGERTDGI